MDKKKLFKVSAACAGFLLGSALISQVDAGEILRNDTPGDTPFSSFPSTQNAYKVALEIYNPGITIAQGEISLRFAAIEISGGQVNPPYTVSFRFTDGDANFSITPPANVWVLVDDPSVPTTVYAASTSGAPSPIITLTSANVDSPGALPSARQLYLMQAQWSDSDSDHLVDFGELSRFAKPTVVLLNKTADCNTRPVWPLGASIQGANGNIYFPIVSFAYVTPQFIVQGPPNNALTAEINADNNFYTFLSGPNVISSTQIDTSSATHFITITDDRFTNPEDWIVWSSAGVVGNISFNLTSASAQPDVTGITFDGASCTETTQDTTWSCSRTGINLIGNFELQLGVSGSSELNPTAWTLSNVNISNLCYNIPTGQIGTWWGGLEIIVPFVKQDPANGYYTTIKLINRYNRNATVYAEPLITNSNRFVVPNTQITTCNANSVCVITGADLANLFANVDFANGVPVKFLIRVPGADWTRDPMIEGIVVADSPRGQRTIPLKIRQFRHGEYNE